MSCKYKSSESLKWTVGKIQLGLRHFMNNASPSPHPVVPGNGNIDNWEVILSIKGPWDGDVIVCGSDCPLVHPASCEQLSDGAANALSLITVPNVAENRICSESLHRVASRNPWSLNVSVLVRQVYSCLWLRLWNIFSSVITGSSVGGSSLK